jgi:hypothetical protein
MNEDLPESRSIDDWEKRKRPSLNSRPFGLQLAITIICLALGITFIVTGVIPHKVNGAPTQSYAAVAFGSALLYCSYLSGWSKSKNAGARVAKGCFGSILFAVAFIYQWFGK